jgi:hypothetical protein
MLGTGVGTRQLGQGRGRRGARSSWRARWAAGLFAVLAAGSSGSARANNALPGSFGILLPVDRVQEIVLATNFGLIISDDGGATFRWTCEQLPTSMANVYNIGPPASSAGGVGDRLFALSPVSGLAFSDDGSCTWQGAGGALKGEIASDFFADPTNPARVLAAAAPTLDGGFAGVASLFESSDGGATFGATPLYSAPAGVTIVGVEIPRANPDEIYLTGYSTAAGKQDPMLMTSSDRGGSWTTIDLGGPLGPSIVRILTVDPANSDKLYLRVIGAGSENVAVTTDAGRSFAVPITIPNGAVSAFARLASGTVLVGALINYANDGGGTEGTGFRSTDGGTTFSSWTLAPQPHIVGLAERVESGKSTLYLSGKNYSDGWALAVSADEGQTIEPLTTYDKVVAIEACAQASCLDSCNYEERQAVWSTKVCSGGGAGTASGGAGVGGSSSGSGSGSGCDASGAGGDVAVAELAALAVAAALVLRRHFRRKRAL